MTDSGIEARAEERVLEARSGNKGPQPQLSILIPFLRDDPMPLLQALASEAAVAPGPVEAILYDDGSKDPHLTRRIRREIAAMSIPVRLISSGRNRGRAAARNALAKQASGLWLLFLDAGMQVGEGFLRRHLEAAQSGGFDAAFAGYRYEVPLDPELALHATIARTSEVMTAAERSRSGPIAFCTGNLLVRRDVAQAVPFDEGYSGWGWEDVDWALRADRQFRLAHFDNPTGRMPSDSPAVLLDKYRAAAPNLARLLERFPELAKTRGVRMADLMRRLPAQRRLRGVWAAAVQSRIFPLGLRAFALKMWRASWAAEAIGK